MNVVSRHSESLNGHQQRRLSVTCQYIDGLLLDIEAALGNPAPKALFPKYIAEVSPQQRARIEEFADRIRQQLLRALQRQNVKPPQASIPASRAIASSTSYIAIAVEELRPRYMKGYGELSQGAAVALTNLADELASLVRELEDYVQRELLNRQ